MPTKRQILERLKRDELLAALDAYELAVDDRRQRDLLVDALGRSRKARLTEILTDLSRDRLKEICRELGLGDGGRKKAELVARLTGQTPAGAPAKGDAPAGQLTLTLETAEAVAQEAHEAAERGRPKQDTKWRIPRRFQWPRHLLRLLGKVSDHAVARRAGVAIDTVLRERWRRGIPAAFPHRPAIEWTDEMISLLGAATDREVAAEFGISTGSVAYKRRKLNIPPYTARKPRRSGFWTPRRDALLGTASDAKIAKKLRTSLGRVRYRRRQLDIPAFNPAPKPVKWTAPMRRLLGKQSDAKVAVRLGISAEAVFIERQRRGIQPAASLPGSIPRNHRVAEIVRKSIAEASEILGVTPDTVRILRKDLGVPGTLPPISWTKRALRGLGKVPDAEIAAELGCSKETVARKRRKLGIRLVNIRPWTPEEHALVGTLPDRVVARKIGRTRAAVANRRRSHLHIQLAEPAPPIQWTESVLSRLGKVPDAELAAELGCRKRTVAQKRRQHGIRRFEIWKWTPEQDALLGTLPDSAVARKIGRTLKAVSVRRRLLGIPPVPERPSRWTKRIVSRLGKVPDAEIAAELGIPRQTVAAARLRRGIRLPDYRPWTPEEEALVGTIPDDEIAKKIGRTPVAVGFRRRLLGLAPVPRRPSRWTESVLSRLGKVPDVEIAAELGTTPSAVAYKRYRLGIPPCKTRRRKP